MWETSHGVAYPNTSNVVELHETVVANIQEADKVRVPAEHATTSEAEYCAHMKQKGKDAANMQKPLHGMCDRVKHGFSLLKREGGIRLLARPGWWSWASRRRRERAARLLTS